MASARGRPPTDRPDTADAVGDGRLWANLRSGWGSSRMRESALPAQGFAARTALPRSRLSRRSELPLTSSEPGGAAY